MGKLHEILAVESDKQAVANNMIAEATQTFQHRKDHFRGHVTSTTYLDEARASENTTDTKPIVTTVDDKLSFLLKHVAAYYDAMYQKEAANQMANADIVVDGKTLLANIPGTTLLSLESRLKQLREMIYTVPTLEPAMVWKADEAAGGIGVFRSDPLVKFSTEKAIKTIVLYPHTEKHPAQVTSVNEDVRVARVETVQQSGMWPVSKKAEVLERLDKLIAAVKQARARANLTEVPTGRIGETLIEYIIG